MKKLAAGQRVQITGRHPHRGEFGTFNAETLRQHLPEMMYRIDLENCQHGVSACYATAGHLKAAAVAP